MAIRLRSQGPTVATVGRRPVPKIVHRLSVEIRGPGPLALWAASFERCQLCGMTRQHLDARTEVLGKRVGGGEPSVRVEGVRNPGPRLAPAPLPRHGRHGLCRDGSSLRPMAQRHLVCTGERHHAFATDDDEISSTSRPDCGDIPARFLKISHSGARSALTPRKLHRNGMDQDDLS